MKFDNVFIGERQRIGLTCTYRWNIYHTAIYEADSGVFISENI